MHETLKITFWKKRFSGLPSSGKLKYLKVKDVSVLKHVNNYMTKKDIKIITNPFKVNFAQVVETFKSLNNFLIYKQII